MASILDRYGIKEVADVSVYKLEDNGEPGALVLYLDTLKVSTIEQTASTADATGGKGNAKLISWDFGKEINVSIEDALFSPKSMAMLFSGDTTVKTSTTATVTRAINYTATGTTLPKYMVKGTDDKDYKLAGIAVTTKPTTGEAVEITWYNETGSTVATTQGESGGKFIGKYTITPASTKTIEISADAFPGTYYFVGDTYARNEASGNDEFFQFIIYKAKITAENTITLQAEGDPSTFNMNLTVLRGKDGKMIDLVQYTL